MKYFIDFDRTLYETDAFKKAIAKRPPVLEVLRQAKAAFLEFLLPSRGTLRRRVFFRTLGTFASHGRFAFTSEELHSFLYPDSVKFLKNHSCTIVTYGVYAFITAKVTTALRDFPDLHIVYTSRKKGRTLLRLTQNETEQCTFIDDKTFQLESVAKWCPQITCIEMRRDGGAGNGKWRVINSFSDLSS